MPNTGGSWSLAGNTPGDAFLVERLRAAGAIVIAKANLSEWANFRSAPSSSGWSGVGGQTNLALRAGPEPLRVELRHGRRRWRPTSRPWASGPRPTGRSCARPAPTASSGSSPRWAWSSRGRHPDLRRPGHGGPDDPQRDRRRGRARRDHRDRPRRPGDRGPGRPRLGATTPRSSTPTRSTVRGSACGATAPTTRTSPEIDALWTRRSTQLEAAGATVDRSGRGSGGRAYGPEFEALLCEFQDDLPAYFETYTGAGYPKTLLDVVEFNNDHPELEGPWNSDCCSSWRARDRRTRPTPRARRPASSRIRSRGLHRRHPRRARPRRDHRPDQRPGVGHRPGQRRRLRRFVARRLPRPSPATRTSPCPPATTGRCRSGSRSWRAPGPSRS